VLTGGTALAAFFLRHRLSEDLDLFTQVPRAVPLALQALRDALPAAGFEVQVVRAFPTFAELSVSGHGETLKVDLAEDTPFRLAPANPGAAEGLALDDLADISANKVAALFDRAQPKDFVDVYFLAQDRAALEDLVKEAQTKHLGMDDYWLAQAFARVRNVNVLPRMVRPLTLRELQDFFIAASAEAMRRVTG
jgi:predicted nucleotidyltransferase component of viral defense system